MCLLFSHLLDRVADMHDDVVVHRDGFILQHEQAHLAHHAFGGAARVVAVDRDDLHGNAEAHNG